MIRSLAVYNPDRLHVLGECVWVVGTIADVRSEEDGDYHVNLLPDAKYRRLLDQGNINDQEGSLVTEIMPGQGLPTPEIGERVAMFGTWVLDTQHGWNEIHPIWGMRRLDLGSQVFALPPEEPLYPTSDVGEQPSQSPRPTAGCDLSYPTVCIPPAPPDLDCADVPSRGFKVLAPDPHNFDGNGDGIGCA